MLLPLKPSVYKCPLETASPTRRYKSSITCTLKARVYMMAMGRGSSIKLSLVVTFLVVTSWPSRTLAAVHIVGDSQGWGFSVSYADWANGKSFAEGDTLVFNYQSGLHNVVPVNAAGYRSCKAIGADSSSVASTGKDRFSLKKGPNYFICSIPGHCSAGMKIMVNA